MTCSVEGCERPRKYKHYCGMHYQRLNAGQDIGSVHAKKAANGSGWINGSGYKLINKTFEHVAVVEKAIGCQLPQGAVIHHINGNCLDNRPENLVVCPSQTYHTLLHQRQRALDACGHADWLKCTYCKQYDAPENLKVKNDRHQGHHRTCEAAYKRRTRKGGNYA